MATDIDAQQNKRVGTILIVDDDEGIREMLISFIETETPYHPLVFGSGDETLQCIAQIRVPSTLERLDSQKVSRVFSLLLGCCYTPASEIISLAWEAIQ